LQSIKVRLNYADISIIDVCNAYSKLSEKDKMP
jgi:hypothetical protein